jgi:hypothetical protein
MYLILPAGVSFGIGALIADPIATNIYKYAYTNDGYHYFNRILFTCGILLTPIFSIIFGWLLNFRQKIGFSEIILKITTIVALTLCTIVAINVYNIPAEVANNNFNFGETFQHGEHGCYSEGDVEKYIENKLNGDKPSFGAIILVYTFIISLYHYIHSAIVYKRSKNKGELWFKIAINTLVPTIITAFILDFSPRRWSVDVYIYIMEMKIHYIDTTLNGLIISRYPSCFIIGLPIYIQTIFFALANKPCKLLKGGSIK